MSELLAKLSKRRSIVEEDGLHFESVPITGQPACGRTFSSPVTGANTRATNGHKVLPQRLSQHDRQDFLSAMERRRATVDDDAETFESKPTAQVADCVHQGITHRKSDTGRLSVGSNGVDIKVIIDQQQAKTPDCGHGVVQVNSSDQKPAILPEAPRAPAAVQLPAEPAASEKEAVADELEVSQEEKVEPTAAATGAGCMEEASTREGEAIERDEELAEDEEEAVEHESTEHEEETPETAKDEEARDAAAQDAGVHGMIAHSGNRISWLVGLRTSSSTATFESSGFEIGGYGPMTFRLRPSGSGCLLSLHGDSPRPPGIRVGLFASKGWRKTAIKPWPEGADVESRFDVDLRGRASILCGLIYKRDR